MDPEEQNSESNSLKKVEPELSLFFTAISSKLILSRSVFNITLFVDKDRPNKKKNEKNKIPAVLHFSAKITGEGETFSSLKELSVSPGKTATLSVKIPELKYAAESGVEYKLHLNVRDEINKATFEGKLFRIIRNKFQIPLLSHTDKGVYKPGDTVKFRIVVLDRNFRPFPDSKSDSNVKVNVKIFDPDQNLVKMGTEASTSYGLFSSEFQLSTDPILGDWQIKYEALVKTQTGQNPDQNEQEHQENGSVRFSVEKYVLPKYQMHIKLSPRITFADDKISVRIEVKYTHGGGVKGQVKLTPSLNYDISDENPNSNLHTLEKILPLDDSGALQTEIEYKNLFGLGKFQALDESAIYIHVEFTDGVTEKKTRQYSSVRLYEHPYKIETWSRPSELIKGLDYTLFIKPTMLDGSPIKISDKFQDVVQIMHPFLSSGNTKEKEKAKKSTGEAENRNPSIPSKIPALKLDADGIAHITFDPSATSRVTSKNYGKIQILFRDLTQTHWIRQHDTSSLVVLIKDPESEKNPNSRNSKPIFKTAADGATKIQIQIQIEVTVVFSTPFQSINYFIVGADAETGCGMNKIFAAGTQDFPSLEKIQHFKIPWTTQNTNTHSSSSVDEKELSLFIFTQVETMQSGKCEFLVKNLLVNSNPDPKSKQKNENFLEISLSEETREPAQNVTLKIKTGKNSLVALKAVDESVLILNNNGDIDNSAISNAKGTRDYWDNYASIPWESELSPSLDLMNWQELRVITNGPLKEYPKYSNGWQAGPGAGNAATYISPPARVRTEFPETWIWEESFSQDGVLNLSKIVPDSLTSWIITGFSISKELGIAALPTPKKLRVDREFFLVLNLPFSVIQGEILHLKVTVHNHNYEKKEILAEVTLENPEEKFELQSDELDKTSNSKTMAKKITVKPDSTSFVTFPIKPVKFGGIDLKVTGSAQVVFTKDGSNGRKGSSGSNGRKGSNRSNYSDALSQKLLVVPPGERQSQNMAVLLTSSDKNVQLSPVFPENSIRLEDSLKISAISDLLGATIDNMNNLIQMPCGCGEQNMLNFVVDIVVLEYLESSSSKTGEKGIREKAIEFLESGYQRELSYRHRDGSFSCFGPSDENGSTWLTAFVLRSFLKASYFIKIDEQVIIKSVLFLMVHQDEKNGNFEEKGSVYDSRMMGNSGSKGVALTAFCLLALLQAIQKDGLKSDDYAKSIQDGLDFILKGTKENNVETESDLYALILTTYALHLADHQEKEQYFQKIEKAARKERDFIFWSHSDSSEQQKSEVANSKVKPVWIEMTGYALLIYMMREGNSKLKSSSESKTLSIVKWLLKHRNSNGGFISTQDTVVGLSAIAQFVKGTKTKDGAEVDLKIVAKYGNEEKEELKITVNEKNSILLQEFILPSSTPSVSLTAGGKGSALVQLSWYYFVQNPVKQPAFALDVTALARPGNIITLKICTGFILAGKESESESESKSNMVIVEVNFPSGFSVDKEMLTSLEKLSNYKRHETENQDNRLNIYFESLSKLPTCFELEGQQMFKVVNPVKTYVSIYDYYDPTRRARYFFTLPKTQKSAQQPLTNATEKNESINKTKVNIPSPSKNVQKNPTNNNKRNLKLARKKHE